LSLSAWELARQVRTGERSALELAHESISRIESLDQQVRAFVSVNADEALQAAAAVDASRTQGVNLGPLAGVPIALKDNICWGRTTCSSRFLESYDSPFQATAARRMADAGLVVVGKTNMDEFAMGSSCENSAFGPTHNPRDLSRVPGGSSGGSAAAVAGGMVPIALGSDTGGSIRQPAAFCGIVGLKPTYGRVSRYGLVAFASSLDQIGPLANTVHDAALGLDQPVEVVRTAMGRARVGVLGGHMLDGLDPAMHAALRATADRLSNLGVEVVEVDLPTASHGIAAYYIIATAEASSNLARFDGIRYGQRASLGAGEDLLELYIKSRSEGFGSEVQRRILLGTHVLSSGYYDEYYAKAMCARRLIRADYDTAFDAAGLGCDAVLMPTTPGPAFKLGEKATDPMALYLEDLFTVGVNLAGLPAISVPAGSVRVDGHDLPLGMQLVGRAFDERRLLQLARLMES
jgi:aspartyl-tRNA(Asn)/glutamyl-tRNA(Gln) amidotransferase subunit A